MKFIKYLIIPFLFFSCQKDSKQVVIYTSVDQIFSEPILRVFEKKTNIKVKAIFDTEETKSTGVLNRLIAEKDNPQCDIFWSGDPIRTLVLKNKGITTNYKPNNISDINPIFIDKDDQWIGFSARARVLLYNKTLLKKADVPKSIFDLTKEKYRGQFAIANPLFGTTTFHIAALFSSLGDTKAKQFLTALKTNNVVIASSNGDVKKRVMKGEVYCGITDTDDAFEAIKESKNVGYVFLDQSGIGSLIMPNTVNLIKNAPNQENAKKLIDYLISKETESKLAQSCAQMPLHKNVKTPIDIPSLDQIIPMKIDYEKTAIKLEEIQQYLKKWSEN